MQRQLTYDLNYNFTLDNDILHRKYILKMAGKQVQVVLPLTT